MKIADAMLYSNLTVFAEQEVQEKTISAHEIAEEIFAEAEQREEPFLYLTPEKWQRKWLPSKQFKLMRFPLNAAALPCEPKGANLVLKKMHAREEKPIVIDYNINQVGKALSGYTPALIVIDGKHRFKAATMRGESHIMAWVGSEALAEIRASKKMCACGCKGIGACMAAKNVKAVGSGGGGPAPDRTTPATGASLIAELSKKGKNIKQMFVNKKGK